MGVLLFLAGRGTCSSQTEMSFAQGERMPWCQNFPCIRWFSRVLAQNNSHAKEACPGVAYPRRLPQSPHVHTRALRWFLLPRSDLLGLRRQEISPAGRPPCSLPSERRLTGPGGGVGERGKGRACYSAWRRLRSQPPHC